MQRGLAHVARLGLWRGTAARVLSAMKPSAIQFEALGTLYRFGCKRGCCSKFSTSSHFAPSALGGLLAAGLSACRSQIVAVVPRAGQYGEQGTTATIWCAWLQRESSERWAHPYMWRI